MSKTIITFNANGTVSRNISNSNSDSKDNNHVLSSTSSGSITVESAIRYIQQEEGEDDNDLISSTTGRLRQGHLLSLMPLSKRVRDENGTLVEIKPFDNGSSLSIAQFLAWKHVQQRNGTVIPSLPQQLQHCDMHFTYQARDTQWKQTVAVDELVNSTMINSTNTSQQVPFAIAGTTTSRIAEPLAILGASYEIPLLSGASTSPALEAKPFFASTIPTNRGDARAIILYLQSMGVKHMASLFQQDEWGRNYNTVLQQEAQRAGISILSWSFDPNNDASKHDAVQHLADSGRRYIYLMDFQWKTVLGYAYDLGIVGNDQYAWFAAGGRKWTKTSFQLATHQQDETEAKLAHALHGIGIVSLHLPEANPGLEQVMTEFVNDHELQREFLSLHPDAFIYDNYTFPQRQLSVYHHMFYDAIVALAVAACRTPGLFSGQQLLQTLSNLQLDGAASGPLQFHPNRTATRDPDTVTYRIDNVFVSDDRSDVNYTRFGFQTGALVRNGMVDTGTNNHTNWLYHGNSTVIPADLPPLEHDYNLIATGAQAFGWSLAVLVILTSLVLMGLVHTNRQRYAIRASQPIFLYQLCIGTLIMGLTLIPMGLQSSTQESLGMDVACMSSVWLLVCGFVVSFSALLCKTWRLNRLMKAGMQMKRISVEPRDVAWTTAVLLTCNVCLLVGWTIVAPLRYVRRPVEEDVDMFGRIVSSTGGCRSDDDKYLYFVIPIVVVNLVGVAGATFQAYKARNFPTILSESKFLALSMASLMETFALGGPVLFAIRGSSNNNPTAFYLVASGILFITICTILLPIFLPKWFYRNAKQQPIRAAGRGSTAVTSTMAGTRVSGLSALSGVSGLDLNVSLHSAKSLMSRDSSVISRNSSVAPRNGPGSRGSLASLGSSFGNLSFTSRGSHRSLHGIPRGMSIISRNGVLTKEGLALQECP